jgi:hypothetical protein
MGGIRAKGPLESPEESHAIVEWAGRPGLSTVYELWWEPDDPNSLADRLRERLRRVVMTAEQAASASTASAVSDVQR